MVVSICREACVVTGHKSLGTYGGSEVDVYFIPFGWYMSVSCCNNFVV